MSVVFLLCTVWVCVLLFAVCCCLRLLWCVVVFVLCAFYLMFDCCVMLGVCVLLLFVPCLLLFAFACSCSPLLLVACLFLC